MNRVIKFRGRVIENGGLFRNRKNGEWIYSSESFVHTDEGIFIGGYNDEVKVDPNTLGMFTGLRDNKGHEIYEGDIVNVLFGEVVVPLLVVFECGGWKIKEECDDTLHDLDYYVWSKDVDSVIGNIFDTPELLETE